MLKKQNNYGIKSIFHFKNWLVFGTKIGMVDDFLTKNTLKLTLVDDFCTKNDSSECFL